MGGNVADFRVVRDKDFGLAVGADIDRTLPFSLPGDTIKGQESILSFMVLDAENGRLDVDINGNNVMNNFRLGSTDMARCIQERCQPNILRDGEGNSITFRVAGGSCTLSDVVIWFQNAT